MSPVFVDVAWTSQQLLNGGHVVDASSPLIKYLGSVSVEYAGKLALVADAAEAWLEYVPETFPQYTTHTVRHSEAIIDALGKLLFKDVGKRRRPVISLSAAEAYVLCAAAYLHDAGMVVPNGEMSEILGSAEFLEWIAPGGPGHNRYQMVATTRAAPGVEDRRNLAADRQLRLLIGEFARRTHHLRASRLVLTMHDAFSALDFGDPALRRTIADICGGHGLDRSALEDSHTFPERRDIRGEQVNVRLLTILLRIGDLLDMSIDRACPIAMQAASPLPPDSVAHWNKYRGIKHQLVAPDRIELVAECETQDEHRFFVDWCKWLVDELEFATRVLPRMARHSGWLPPFASLTGQEPTIQIGPSPTAHYLPREWRFELDQQTVFDRLVRDIYRGQFTFVRELLQNAADATRCQIYAAHYRDSPGPPSPTEIDATVRNAFPITIAVKWVEVENDLSGEVENRQEISVDDLGSGMDEDIIAQYLLQVGKSYYTSREFSRRFGFTPVSRFGLGFLSVFAESRHVVVETRSHEPGQKAIRLLLTGPRNYILTEQGDRMRGGTKITVRIDANLQPGQLTRMVRSWSQRLEFPISVDDFGRVTEFVAEQTEDLISTTTTKDGATFAIRSFPVAREGIEGDLLVFAFADSDGESWIFRSWARTTYVEANPSAEVPDLPTQLLAVGGITIHERSSEYSSASYRLDYRTTLDDVILSRDDMRMWMPGRDLAPDEAVRSRWAELLSEHLASPTTRFGIAPWRYRQQLSSDFRIEGYWEDVDGVIPLVRERGSAAVSVREASHLATFWTAHDAWRNSEGVRREAAPPRNDLIDLGEISQLDRGLTSVLFQGAEPEAVEPQGRWLLVRWARNVPGRVRLSEAELRFLPFSGLDGLVVADSGISTPRFILINTQSVLGTWIEGVISVDREREPAKRLTQLLANLATNWRNFGRLDTFVREWRQQGLEPEAPTGIAISESTIAPWRHLKVR